MVGEATWSFFSSSGFFFFLNFRNDNYAFQLPLELSAYVSDLAESPDLLASNLTKFMLGLWPFLSTPSISGKEAEYIRRVYDS